MNPSLLQCSLLDSSKQNPKSIFDASSILHSHLINHRACQFYFLSIFGIHLFLSISSATTLIQATAVSFSDFHNRLQIVLPDSTLGPFQSIHHIIAQEIFLNANQMISFSNLKLPNTLWINISIINNMA